MAQLMLVLGLVAINALLSGTEIALISLREPELARMEQRGRSGHIVADLARDPNRYLATIQIGITLAGFMASAVAAVSIAQPILGAFAWAGDAAETVAVVTVTLLLAFLTLVFGELAPKRLALQRPERWALTMALPLHWFSVLMTPFVWLLSVCTDAVVWLFRGKPGATRDEVDLEELRELILASGGLADDHHEVLVGAFELVDRTVEQVMTPRTDVRTVEANRSASDAIEEMISSGFSRLPVTEVGRGLDGAIGVIDMSDAVAADPPSTVDGLAKEAPAFPETMTVLAALRQLQAVRQQMAFVIDEFGGLEGIVTIEDLVEEMVGEIYDEDDRDVASVRLETDGSYLVPGRYPMHDLKDIGVDIGDDSTVTTVAGMVLAQFGRVPAEGDSVHVDGWTIDVVRVDGNAIELLRFSTVVRPE